MPPRRRRSSRAPKPPHPPQKPRSFSSRIRATFTNFGATIAEQPYLPLLLAIFATITFIQLGLPVTIPSTAGLSTIARNIVYGGSMMKGEVKGDEWGKPVYGYSVVKRYNHEERPFIQGILVERGGVGGGVKFMESTGLYGKSEVRTVDVSEGVVRSRAKLNGDEFGEGLARVWEGGYVQMLWKGGKGILWEVDEGGEWRRSGEIVVEGGGDAWGLASDGVGGLFLSDGSDVVRVMRLVRGEREGLWVLKEARRIWVRDEGRGVFMLNELEVVEGELWANVYYSDLLCRIDPRNGEVLGWVDFGGLLKNVNVRVDVLNGIAYDEVNRRLFVTGKLWPSVYQVEIDRVPKHKHVGLMKPFFFDQRRLKILQDAIG